MLILSAVLMLGGLVAEALMSVAMPILGIALVLALFVFSPYTWDEVFTFIEYVYLIRFQIIFAVLLAAVLPALYWILPSIFVGLFDARGVTSFTFVVWAAFQLAWTIMTTSRLVLVYGPDRFAGLPILNIGAVRTRTVILFGLLAVPPVATACLGTLELYGYEKFIGVLVGLAVAILGLLATAKVHFTIEDPSGDTANRVFPSFGRFRQTGSANRRGLWRFVDSWVTKLPAKLQGGIVRAGHLRSGHQLAASAVGFLFVAYVVLGIVYLPQAVRPEKQPAALFYLIFLLTVFTWLLSGTAFFLDKLRLPVFTSLLALSLFSGIQGTDHEFAVENSAKVTPLPPGVVVNAWARKYKKDTGKDPKTAIVVATAGGGIRASAWTAQVLTGLQHECGSGFGSSLLLVSSVSGGSVGTLFVLSDFDGNRTFPAPGTSFDDVLFASHRSSLSAVGWGLLYPDLARTVPVFGSVVGSRVGLQTIDRGWALENAWISGWKTPLNMSDWRADVAEGRRPAVIFNTTASENGKRVVIASADVASSKAVSFMVDAGVDIPAATAARLSASFPYVSPQSRASDGKNSTRVHLADGGYYDNSGILSALEWITAAKEPLKGYRVVLLLIDATPDPEDPTRSWSWQRQLIGPLGTLLKVRSSSQNDRDALESEWVKNGIGGIPIESVPFTYQTTESCEGKGQKSIFSSIQPDQSSPLSWHLNHCQLKNVENAWNELLAAPDEKNSRQQICRIVQGTP